MTREIATKGMRCAEHYGHGPTDPWRCNTCALIAGEPIRPVPCIVVDEDTRVSHEDTRVSHEDARWYPWDAARWSP